MTPSFQNPPSEVTEAWLDEQMLAHQEFSESKGYALADPRSIVLYFHIPESDVVLFQGHFELYEGLGLVRTLSIRDSLVCLLTTPECLSDCLLALDDMRKVIRWTVAPFPFGSGPFGLGPSGFSGEVQHRFLGYFKNAQNNT